MKQTVLSINDDKMTTRGELIEYPAELIGGRNLLSGLNREYYLNNTGRRATTIISKNFNFKRNSEYVISYDIKGAWQTGFVVDGITHPISTISSDGQTGSDAGGDIIFPLTNEWKRIWIKIKTANWSDEEYTKQIDITARPYSEVYIRDIMFVSGNKAFDWTPTPEDLGLTYPDWVTEFKPSISEDGVLAPEFDESGVLSFSINRTTAQEFIENPNL